MQSQMLLLFFISHISAKLVAFFHFICFIKTGCFKAYFFCLLSILCFVVKNDLRRKISFRFFSKIQYAASNVTFFSLFRLICFVKTGCFFHVICFLRSGCFFSCHMFHQNWLIQMFGVWLILL